MRSPPSHDRRGETVSAQAHRQTPEHHAQAPPSARRPTLPALLSSARIRAGTAQSAGIACDPAAPQPRATPPEHPEIHAAAAPGPRPGCRSRNNRSADRECPQTLSQVRSYRRQMRNAAPTLPQNQPSLAGLSRHADTCGRADHASRADPHRAKPTTNPCRAVPGQAAASARVCAGRSAWDFRR